MRMETPSMDPRTASDSQSTVIEMLENRYVEGQPGGGEEGTNEDPEQHNDEEAQMVATHNPPTTLRAGAETMRKRILQSMEIVKEKEFGKQLLGVAIAMGVAVVLSATSLVQSTEMNIVAISLSVSITLIFNGILLGNTFSKCSTWMLLLGAALMILSFFALVGFILPVYLKWIPLLCCLASLIPFILYAWASIQTRD